ncbi:MAG: hypothetical protein VXZ59_08335 [Cyanobacteriota bacterium]|nr:hypothetical protein [Cyanobacteriota bacterium]
MHFSWSQHLELARAVSSTADNNKGTALALMGVGLTLLMRDLEQTVPGKPMFTRSSLAERS